MGIAAVEKTEEELSKEIEELHRQQREADKIDSEDQPALKRRLSSSVVKVEDGEVPADAEGANDVGEKDSSAEATVDVVTASDRHRRSFDPQGLSGLRRDGSQSTFKKEADVPPTEHVPRILPKDEDPSLVKRNKRMLGQLLGNLEMAHIRPTSRDPADELSSLRVRRDLADVASSSRARQDFDPSSPSGLAAYDPGPSEGSREATPEPVAEGRGRARRGGRGRAELREPRVIIPPGIADQIRDTPLLRDLRIHPSACVRADLDLAHPSSHYRGSWALFSETVTGCSVALRREIGRFGFGHFITITGVRLDRPLIAAMMERFFPETMSFHLPDVEIGIRPSDFALITGIRMTGDVIPELVRPADSEITRLLGYDEMPVKAWDKSRLTRISRTWLRETFLERGFRSIAAMHPDFPVAFRFLFLLMMGSCFCPEDTTSVSPHFLSLLGDLPRARDYAWGQLVYGTLLAGLRRVVCGLSAPRGAGVGCRFFWPFLQFFARVYVSHFRPTSTMPEDTFPVARRWSHIEHDSEKSRPRSARAHLDRTFRTELSIPRFEDIHEVLALQPFVDEAFALDQRRQRYPFFIGQMGSIWYLGERFYFQHTGELRIPEIPPDTAPVFPLGPFDPAHFGDWVAGEALLVEGDYDAWFSEASVGYLMPPMPVRGGVTEIGGVVIRSYDTTEAQLGEIRARYADLERQLAEQDAIITDLRAELARAQDQVGPSQVQKDTTGSFSSFHTPPRRTQFSGEVFSVGRVVYDPSPRAVEVREADPKIVGDAIFVAAPDAGDLPESGLVPESALVPETNPVPEPDQVLETASDDTVELKMEMEHAKGVDVSPIDVDSSAPAGDSAVLDIVPLATDTSDFTYLDLTQDDSDDPGHARSVDPAPSIGPSSPAGL